MEIRNTLKNYIVTEIMHEQNLSVLDDEAALIENGIIDSMALIELVKFIEKHFNVEISEEELDIDNFRTLNCLIGFVQSKIAGE